MNSVSLRHSPHVFQEISVGTIYAVGLNYARHIAEMQSQRPAEPVIFLKPASALVSGGGQVPYPPQTTDLHHEVELVVLLGSDARHLDLDDAPQVIQGYGLGLDLTLRDRQARAKAKGQPWAVAKGFAASAPVSTFLPAEHLDPADLELSLRVNGELRQQGRTREMLFSIPELLVYLSSVFQLQRGDLIFTGTPDGVGALQRGDKAEARLDDLLSLTVEIV